MVHVDMCMVTIVCRRAALLAPWSREMRRASSQEEVKDEAVRLACSIRRNERQNILAVALQMKCYPAEYTLGQVCVQDRISQTLCQESRREKKVLKRGASER